jgi:prepilin-type N-terminal cleavage/methylation domain-containing protein
VRAALAGARRRAGVTLVELLIVIAIVAALSALAYQSFGAARQQATYKSYVSQAQALAAAVSAYFAVNGCYPASGSTSGLLPYVGGQWPNGFAYYATTGSPGPGGTPVTQSGATATYVDVYGSGLQGLPASMTVTQIVVSSVPVSIC